MCSKGWEVFHYYYLSKNIISRKRNWKVQFLSWNLLITYFRGKEVEWVIPFYYPNTFLIMPNKLLYFSVYELVNLSFWNNNLICTLQFRDVGFLVEISISSSIVCYYCFYYFDSFYKLCFSLGEKITIWFHFDMSAMLL